MNEMKNALAGFVCHGINFHKGSGNQAIGDCIFCGKKNHFFVNIENRLWDCKRCGVKGNFNQFLELISQQNIKNLNDEALTKLAISRKLPKAAFAKWEVGWNGKEYTLPVRSSKGAIADLRRFQIGKKTMATAGASLGLLGEHKLAQMLGKDAYICEGEWDTIALAWLFKKLDTNSVAVGVPGASVFKNEWRELFVGRNVFLMHDNDSAGEQGKALCYEKLNGTAKEIKVISWPESLPEGFDVRDFITTEAIFKKTPRAAWSKLRALFAAPKPTRPPANAPTPALGPLTPSGPPPSSQKVFETYKKWLYLASDDCLKIIFGTIFANRIQGDPLWMFIVAPPGGSKSELLMTLSRHPLIETLSSLTPQALISGARGHNGEDQSLLPKLNGKVLVVKDFTTILSMHYSSRDEIFGILRDSYDGKIEKAFGIGGMRRYNVHFGILAGVTPRIDILSSTQQSLGERFLKFRMNHRESFATKMAIIDRAIFNVNKETQMREELSAMAHKVLDTKIPDQLPKISNEVHNRIKILSQFCAEMRGAVERDRFNAQKIMYRATAEVGSRLSKQIIKLGMGIAIYLNRKEIDLEILNLLKKVATDSVPDLVEDVVRKLWDVNQNPEDSLSTKNLSMKVGQPHETCSGILKDLQLLKLVKKTGLKGQEWRLEDSLIELIKQGLIYPPPIFKPTQTVSNSNHKNPI